MPPTIEPMLLPEIQTTGMPSRSSTLLEHTDVGEPERGPAGKRQPDSHRWLDRDRLSLRQLSPSAQHKREQANRRSYPLAAHS
jgi:hypothetical protein